LSGEAIVTLEATRWARAHRTEILDELGQLLRFPSISGDPTHLRDLAACADWLARHLRRIGMARVELRPTPTAPVVIATTGQTQGKPHVVVYGHYDVQPVTPKSAWRTAPFEPTLIGDDLHARGASDDKGQLFAHLTAAQATLRTAGRLPVALTIVLEGEEEIGSPHLGAVLGKLAGEGLRPAVAVLSDTRMLGPTRPVIINALRGSLQLDVRVERPGSELHVGAFGGAFLNPAHVLADAVSSLHDSCSRVAVDHFHDGIPPPAPLRRDLIARHGPSDTQLRRHAHGAPLAGDQRFSAFERTTIRPAVNVVAMSSGSAGPGNRNAVPNTALARINVRLVPGQDPTAVVRRLRAHIAAAVPPSARGSVRVRACTPPIELDPDDPAIRQASSAYERAFGRAASLLPTGGTIPAVPLLRSIYGVPVVLMGFGLPDDNMHAPNEKLNLPVFWRAIDTCIWYLHAAGYGIST
jgi:acetylornithine deacetylase/succinyl-diaminopimelate desuccinylase-like protein